MTDRAYASTTCPSCGVALDPPPKSKKRCQQCGQEIYVRGGPDGLTYLLAERDLAAHQERWDAHDDEQERAWAAAHNAATARRMAQVLADYARDGVRVEMFAGDDACPSCRALHGRVFDAAGAPPIPVPGCSEVICRCDYLPLV